MFTIAFISLLSAAPVQSTTITLPETVIVVRSIAQDDAGNKLVRCGAPRDIGGGQTVRSCEVGK